LSYNSITHSELDLLIPPEIKDDELYSCIMRLAGEAPLANVLEIGSSAGGGSTEAFVTGLRQNPDSPRLFCMEVSRPRFEMLQERYRNEPFVHCLHASSVSEADFPSEREVSLFYRWIPTALNHYPLEQVLGWLRQDRGYITEHDVPENGIRQIMDKYRIALFDMVLIDGSEFLGTAELNEVYGAGIIVLDDVNGFKNHYNYRRLRDDSAYWLAHENMALRNGFAIFIRR